MHIYCYGRGGRFEGLHSLVATIDDVYCHEFPRFSGFRENLLFFDEVFRGVEGEGCCLD